MRFTAQLLLTIFFVVLFQICLLAATFKFQLLDFSFWQKTFDKNNVYQDLAVAGKNSLESQIAREGGSKNDARVLTNLITTENVEDIVGNNVKNILNFANGKSAQIIVYIPIQKFPKGLLPKNFIGIQSEIPLKDLLTKLNYQNYQNLPLDSIAHSGEYARLVFWGSASLLILILILLILLIGAGGRFVAPGVAVLLSGILAISSSKIGDTITTIPLNGLVKILVTPLIREITGTWLIIGVVLAAAGLVLFFVRKPQYNITK